MDKEKYIVDGIITELTLEEAIKLKACKVPIYKIGGSGE